MDEIGNLLKKNNNIDEIYNEYKFIFVKIKEKLGNNEEKIYNFIESLINYYNINNYLIIDEFNILFKSKKYEEDIMYGGKHVYPSVESACYLIENGKRQQFFVNYLPFSP